MTLFWFKIKFTFFWRSCLVCIYNLIFPFGHYSCGFCRCCRGCVISYELQSIDRTLNYKFYFRRLLLRCFGAYPWDPWERETLLGGGFANTQQHNFECKAQHFGNESEMSCQTAAEKEMNPLTRTLMSSDFANSGVLFFFLISVIYVW